MILNRQFFAQPPAPNPAPAPVPMGEVHVWRASLDRSRADLAPLLSEAERERAAAYRFDRDRERFVAARGRLRQLLGGYLGVDPSAVAFSAGRFGKPELDRDQAARLQFNVSHSAGSALFAFCCAGPVGVDVERISPRVDLAQLAPAFLTDPEFEQVRRLANGKANSALLRHWTAKEAFLKAVGVGLNIAPSELEVAFGNAESPGAFRYPKHRALADLFAEYPLYECEGECATLVAIKGLRVVWCE
ncbi:MAG: 4'-phosphopantetheinyl transferase superfamily protein [Verrucomicrobiales bacterium]